jgi:replication-associated recombination protein RarA
MSKKSSKPPLESKSDVIETEERELRKLLKELVQTTSVSDGHVNVLEQILKQIDNLLTASRDDNVVHIALYGPPGAGKSYLTNWICTGRNDKELFVNLSIDLFGTLIILTHVIKTASFLLVSLV